MGLAHTFNPAHWSVSCWSPGYVLARIRNAAFYRRHPEMPWLCVEAVRFLDTWLRPGDRVLEFGSGRSTLYFARKCAWVTSVEHNVEWHGKISRDLNRLAPDGGVCLLAESEEAYTNSCGKHSGPYDLVLVDGIYRHACAMRALDHVRPGGMVVIDDAQRYRPTTRKLPGAKGRWEDIEHAQVWAGLFDRVASWRSFLADDGVAQTLFLFAPD